MMNDLFTKRDGGDTAGAATRARSDAELRLQDIVDGLRVGLAAG